MAIDILWALITLQLNNKKVAMRCLSQPAAKTKGHPLELSFTFK